MTTNITSIPMFTIATLGDAFNIEVYYEYDGPDCKITEVVDEADGCSVLHYLTPSEVERIATTVDDRVDDGDPYDRYDKDEVDEILDN